MMIDKEKEMLKVLVGIILGLFIASVGFGGVARILDKSVDTVKTTAYTLAQ